MSNTFQETTKDEEQEQAGLLVFIMAAGLCGEGRGWVRMVWSVGAFWPYLLHIRVCPYITSAAITRQGQSECLRTLT